MDKILKLESAYFANKSIKAEEKKLTTYQPLHWHDFYEIEYIIDGEGEYIINGNSNKIEKGALFFSTPADIQEIKFTRETHLINLSFTSHYIDDKLITPTLSSYIVSNPKDFYEYMLRNIIKVLRNPIKNRSLYLKCIVTSIMVMILEQGRPLEVTRSHIAAHKNLRNIIFFINKHFNEPIDLEILAKEANLTPKYLSKRFVQLSGVTISQYILDVRLNYAKNLVVTTDIPFKQICNSCGFNAMPHFSRVFKNRFKVSPSHMRDIAQNAKN